MCSKCQQMIEVLSPKHLSNNLNHVHVGCTCLPDFPAVAALLVSYYVGLVVVLVFFIGVCSPGNNADLLVHMALSNFTNLNLF